MIDEPATWSRRYLLLNGIPGVLFVAANLIAPGLVLEGYAPVVTADAGGELLVRFYGAVLLGFTAAQLLAALRRTTTVPWLAVATVLWHLLEVALWAQVLDGGGSAQGVLTHVAFALLGFAALVLDRRPVRDAVSAPA